MNKTQTARFESWYKYFPKKASRGDGEKAWETLDPDDNLTQQMILAIQAQIRYRSAQRKAGDWNDKFWKAAGPWIRQKCWLDEIGSHAELKEKAESKICCIDGCQDPVLGSRFIHCEHHYQFTRQGRLRDRLTLVPEIRKYYANHPEIRGLTGRKALDMIIRKARRIGK